MNLRSTLLFTLLSTSICSGCRAEFSVDDNDGRWPSCDDSSLNDLCPCEDRALYLSHDTDTCEELNLFCPDGYEPFSAVCGCGCVLPSQEEPPPTCTEDHDPKAVYLSRDKNICSMLTISCGEGHAVFTNDCGCGCIEDTTPPPPPPPPACPDANDAHVTYVNTDPAICASIAFQCTNACDRFDSTCGCGCIVH